MAKFEHPKNSDKWRPVFEKILARTEPRQTEEEAELFEWKEIRELDKLNNSLTGKDFHWKNWSAPISIQALRWDKHGVSAYEESLMRIIWDMLLEESQELALKTAVECAKNPYAIVAFSDSERARKRKNYTESKLYHLLLSVSGVTPDVYFLFKKNHQRTEELIKAYLREKSGTQAA